MNNEIKNLKREIQLLRRVGLAALMTILAVFLCAAKPQIPGKHTTVRAPFHVVDRNGRTSVVIDVPEGKPCLRLYDDKGGVAAILSSNRDGGNLTINNKSGTAVVRVTALPEGGLVGITDNTGTARVYVKSSETGGLVDVRDNNGSVGVVLGGGDHGGGRVFVFGSAGERLFSTP